MGVGRGVVQGSRGRGEHLVLRELDVALVVQKHNVQLQVPVDDAGLVEVVQRQADLSALEPGVPLHVQQIVAASVKLDHEEQFARSLEAGVRTNQGRKRGLAAVCTQSM